MFGQKVELFVEREAVRANAVAERVQVVKGKLNQIAEYRNKLNQVKAQRGAAIQEEMRRIQQMQEVVLSERQMYEKQQAEVQRMREEIAKILQAKEMEEQRRREAEEHRRQEQQRALEEQRKQEEERRLQLEQLRAEEQRRIDEAKRRLEDEKRALEDEKQRALAQLHSRSSAGSGPTSSGNGQSTLSAPSAPSGQWLDIQQANTEYARTADDFGTVAGQNGPGEKALFFQAGHEKFSPGFYPETPDYGSLFSLAKPARSNGSNAGNVSASDNLPSQPKPVASAPVATVNRSGLPAKGTGSTGGLPPKAMGSPVPVAPFLTYAWNFGYLLYCISFFLYFF